MGSRSEPSSADHHVIAMCNGGVKTAICNGTATPVKNAAIEPVSEPVSTDVANTNIGIDNTGIDIGFPEIITEEPTVFNDPVDPPVCPRLIITDADGVVYDQWEDFIDVASSNDGSDQLDLPTVIEANTGMNIRILYA